MTLEVEIYSHRDVWRADITYEPGTIVLNAFNSLQYLSIGDSSDGQGTNPNLNIRPDTDPTRWRLLSTGIPTGVIFGTQADIFSADNPTTIHSNGAAHAVPLLKAAPPAWMDNAGHIIAPGVYSFSMNVNVENNRTTAGLKMFLAGVRSVPLTTFDDTPFDTIDIDAIQSGSGGLGGQFYQSQEVQAIGPADLPFPITWTAYLPNDATLNLNFLGSAGMILQP